MKKLLLLFPILCCLLASEKVQATSLNLDSIVSKYADGTPSIKEKYAYDNRGNMTLNARYKWDANTGTWISLYNYQYEYEYDENGNETRYTWRGEEKGEKMYDKHGNVTSYTTWGWDITANNWINNSKKIVKYDESGKEIIFLEDYSWNREQEQWKGFRKYIIEGNVETSSKWDEEINEWVESSKNKEFYNDKGLLSATMHLTKENNEWVESGQSQRFYNDRGLLLSSIHFTGKENNKWISIHKREYTYDDGGNQTLAKHSNWDTQTNTWIANYRWEVTFDKNGNTLTSEQYRWNSSKNIWEGYVAKSERRYDDAGNHVYYLRHIWDYSTNQWVIDSKIEMTFNHNGSETQKLHFDWRNDSWIEKDKYEYEYDSDQNQILYAKYKWNIQENQWTYIDKDEYQYDEYSNQVSHSSYSYEEGILISIYTTSYYYSKGESSLESDKNFGLHIYPNPVTDGFYIQGLNSENTQLLLSDLAGRIHLDRQISDNQFINISSLPRGVYLVEVRTKGIAFGQKIIKQ